MIAWQGSSKLRMATNHCRGHTARVDGSGRGRQPTVLVSVLPRLFADALSIAMRAHGVEVVRHLDPDSCALNDRSAVDVAITTGSLPDGIRAATVIVLPEPGGPAPAARVIGVGGAEDREHLGDLADVVALVRRHLGPNGR
jgi:hypothetical protein